MERYLKRWLVWLDQGVNVAFGGSEDETVSSVVGRKALAGVWWAKMLRPVIDMVFGWLGEKDHCYRNIEWDEVKNAPRS